MPAAFPVFKANKMILAFSFDVALKGGRWHFLFTESKGLHGAFCMLPGLWEIQQRYAVQTHIRVVCHSQSYAVSVIPYIVIIPLLDPSSGSLDVAAVIYLQMAPGIAGSGKTPLRGQQILFFCYFLIVKKRKIKKHLSSLNIKKERETEGGNLK